MEMSYENDDNQWLDSQSYIENSAIFYTDSERTQPQRKRRRKKQ